MHKPPSSSPILRFVLLLTPLPVLGFMFVYSMSGWLVDGNSLARWRYEAVEVMGWSAAMIAGYQCLVMTWARWRQFRRTDLMYIAAGLNLLISVLCLASVLWRV